MASDENGLNDFREAARDAITETLNRIADDYGVLKPLKQDLPELFGVLDSLAETLWLKGPPPVSWRAERQKRRHRKKGLGLSYKDFSDYIDTPLKDVMAMVEHKQVKVLTIGTLKRIPYSEADRIRAEFGQAAD